MAMSPCKKGDDIIADVRPFHSLWYWSDTNQRPKCYDQDTAFAQDKRAHPARHKANTAQPIIKIQIAEWIHKVGGGWVAQKPWFQHPSTHEHLFEKTAEALLRHGVYVACRFLILISNKIMFFGANKFDLLKMPIRNCITEYCPGPVDASINCNRLFLCRLLHDWQGRPCPAGNCTEELHAMRLNEPDDFILRFMQCIARHALATQG
jgi:hypothetical protein